MYKIEEEKLNVEEYLIKNSRPFSGFDYSMLKRIVFSKDGK